MGLLHRLIGAACHDPEGHGHAVPLAGAGWAAHGDCINPNPTPFTPHMCVCAQSLANADHTTLLLNCYTKLKDVAKLDAFLRGAGAADGAGALPFDVETAVKVCFACGTTLACKITLLCPRKRACSCELLFT